MRVGVIIPAAGKSQRFKAANGGASASASASAMTSDPLGLEASRPASKLEQDLAGQAVFVRAAEAFLKRTEVQRVLLAVAPGELEAFRSRWGPQLGLLGVELVAGGITERWETVQRALGELASEAELTHVAVHDAARPLVSQALVSRVFAAARRYPAVIPGLAVSSTLKRVEPLAAGDEGPAAAGSGGGGEADLLGDLLGGQATGGDAADAGEPVRVQRVVATVDRRQLVRVQTPQVFELGLLRRAYATLAGGEIPADAITDDAGLVEALGEPVHVVEGEARNFKITLPEDLELARQIVVGSQGAGGASRVGGRYRRHRHDDDED